MKNLKKLKGVKMLSKTEQKVIAGGSLHCNVRYDTCPPGWYCYFPTQDPYNGWCVSGEA